METNNELVMRGVDVINQVTLEALNWMKGNKSFINKEFIRVFKKESPELISHLIDKWDGDFARFYLNADEKTKRDFFEGYSIPLEEDKYPDSEDLFMALIDGKPKVDVYPFESHVVHLFYLIAYNNSLELLENIIPDAFIRIKKNKVNLYGNGLHWSQAWKLLTNEEKEILVNYVLINKDN